MKKYIWILLIVVTVFLLGGWITHKRDITKVSITTYSGTVAPEYQYKEVLSITMDEVTFTRTGSVDDTKVNEGTWSTPANKEAVKIMFSQLEKKNFFWIMQIWFIPSRTGDGYRTYEIEYGKGKTFTLDQDLGKDYINIRIIKDPIDNFFDYQDYPSEQTK